MDDDFIDIVGSENYETSKDEFIGGLHKCKENEYTVDPETNVIIFTKACPNLVLHYPELYTEIFCSKCQICVEVNLSVADDAPPVSDTGDELDEFMSIAGSQHYEGPASHDWPYCESDGYIEE